MCTWHDLHLGQQPCPVGLLREVNRDVTPICIHRCNTHTIYTLDLGTKFFKIIIMIKNFFITFTCIIFITIFINYFIIKFTYLFPIFIELKFPFVG